MGESSAPRRQAALLGWGLILVVTIGIFVGTLALKPKTEES